MELSTLSAWLPELTLKGERRKEELNLRSVTKDVKGLQHWSSACNGGV